MKKILLATAMLALLTSYAMAQDSKIAVEGNFGGLKFNFLLNNPHNYGVNLQAPGLSVRTVPQSGPPSTPTPPTAAPQPQPVPPVAVAPPQPEPQQPEVQLPPVPPPTAEPPEPEKKSTSEYFNPGMQGKDAAKPRPYQQQ
jgi:outer membrane biosynthesis protein TonB